MTKGSVCFKFFRGYKKDWCFTSDYILEKVDLKEISVVIARYKDGTYYVEPIENIHKNQIYKSKIPANISTKFTKKLSIMLKNCRKINYVSSYCRIFHYRKR